MNTLDVGCGCKPQGTVNIDNSIEGDFHRGFKRMTVFPNFVKADAHHIPFRRKVFAEVFCKNVLEHRGVRYVEVIREMMSVGNRLSIEAPTVMHSAIFAECHDKVFSKRVFQRIFKQYEVKMQSVRMWRWLRMMKTPFHILDRLVRHKRYFHNKVVNLLHLFPCPFTTSIKVHVFLDGKNEGE